MVEFTFGSDLTAGEWTPTNKRPREEAMMWEFYSGNAKVVISDNFIRLTGPAITPQERHKIEEALQGFGFEVDGGGTNFQDKLSDIFLARRAPWAVDIAVANCHVLGNS